MQNIENGIYFATLLDAYGNLLNKYQRDILECYYFEDMSLAEIAENKNCTRQAVQDLIKRCEQKLIDYENKVGLVDLKTKLKNLCNELGSGGSNAFSERIEKIIDKGRD